MGHVRVSVDGAGRFVVPKDVREQLGIPQGGELLLSVENGALVAMTRMEALRRAQAMFQPWQPGQPLMSEELIAERREAAKREAAWPERD